MPTPNLRIRRAQLDLRVSLVIRTCATLFLVLASPATNATVVEPRDLSDLVQESVFIGSVWIQQSTSINDGPEASYPACGASYRARTVDVLKGTSGVITFLGSEDLVVGREYFVLLAQGLKSTTVIVSFTTLAGTPSRTKTEWMAECSRRHPGLWAVNGSESAFIDRRQRIVVPGQAGDRWVAQRSFLVSFDVNPQFDTDALGAPWAFGPSPYPTGVYLSWRSVRTLLTQVLAKAAPDSSSPAIVPKEPK